MTSKIYNIWLEKTGLEYLKEHREKQTLESLVIFLDDKGGKLAPLFLAHFGVTRVIEELQEKIQELR